MWRKRRRLEWTRLENRKERAIRRLKVPTRGGVSGVWRKRETEGEESWGQGEESRTPGPGAWLQTEQGVVGRVKLVDTFVDLGS